MYCIMRYSAPLLHQISGRMASSERTFEIVKELPALARVTATGSEKISHYYDWTEYDQVSNSLGSFESLIPLCFSNIMSFKNINGLAPKLEALSNSCV